MQKANCVMLAKVCTNYDN